MSEVDFGEEKRVTIDRVSLTTVSQALPRCEYIGNNCLLLYFGSEKRSVTKQSSKPLPYNNPIISPSKGRD